MPVQGRRPLPDPTPPRAAAIVRVRAMLDHDQFNLQPQAPSGGLTQNASRALRNQVRHDPVT